MNTTKSRLGFELPIIVENLPTKLDISPAGIKSWCANLPMTQTGYVAKEVYFALAEILQSTIDARDLFTILESLQPAVQWISQGLKKYYVEQTKPLDENQLIIVNLSQTLQANMLMGYKRIIDELAVDDFGKSKQQHIIIAAIFQALQHARTILICNYQLYTIASANFWRELYIIYAFCDEHNLMEKLYKEDSTQRISALFKMIFLLVATNPYQWRQTEQELINAAIFSWEPYAIMRPARKSDFEEAGVFILDLYADYPPEPAMLKKVNFSPSCIAIELSALAVHLAAVLEEFRVQGEQTKQKHERESEFHIPLNSLKILCAQWAKPIVRKEERIKSEGEIEVVFGYTAVHYFVNDKKVFDLKKLDKAFEYKNITTTTEETAHTAEYVGYMCKQVDTSKSGSLIVWHGTEDVEMLPDRIVGFKNKESLGHAPWMLGVVAWVKRLNKQELMMGLEHLDVFAQAVAIQIEKDGEGSGNFQLGFLLPRVEKFGNTPTVITPVLPFKKDSTVRIVMDDNNTKEDMIIILHKEIYETRSFKQFEFKIKSINEAAILDKDVKHFEFGSTAEDKMQGQAQGLFADKYDGKFDTIWDKLE